MTPFTDRSSNAHQPTIFVDADACPVTSETLAVARTMGLPVVIAGNSTQNLERHIRRGDARASKQGFWVDTLTVGVGADSADFAIIEALQPHDIVVTQDIGLAAMVLGRSAYAIGVRGRVFTLATIDLDMEIRHVEKKIRRQGGRTKGPAPFTDDDRDIFTANLKRLVNEALNL
ncbi:MAG: DUF188 domain-containing protein [Raoultibacter sp.]